MEYEHFVGIIIGIVISAIIACCSCYDSRTPAEKISDAITKQEKIVNTRYEWYMNELNKLNEMKEVRNDNN